MLTVKRWVKHNNNTLPTKNNIEIKPDMEITINDTKYFLKSVVEHEGDDTEQGHYTVSCIQENGTWIKCNDLNISQSQIPMKGYIFFYEKSLADQYVNTTANNTAPVTSHSNDIIYNCTLCDSSFTLKQEFENHINPIGNQRTTVRKP